VGNKKDLEKAVGISKQGYREGGWVKSDKEKN
jgi:hypothetical protein